MVTRPSDPDSSDGKSPEGDSATRRFDEIASMKALLVKKLKAMLRSKADDHFLIITAGDYYVQYIRGEPGAIYGEAVGGDHLPGGKAKHGDYDLSLRNLGFAVSEMGGQNFSRTYILKNVDPADIIDEAIHIFETVYRVDDAAPVSFELNA